MEKNRRLGVFRRTLFELFRGYALKGVPIAMAIMAVLHLIAPEKDYAEMALQVGGIGVITAFAILGISAGVAAYIALIYKFPEQR